MGFYLGRPKSIPQTSIDSVVLFHTSDQQPKNGNQRIILVNFEAMAWLGPPDFFKSAECSRLLLLPIFPGFFFEREAGKFEGWTSGVWRYVSAFEFNLCILSRSRATATSVLNGSTVLGIPLQVAASLYGTFTLKAKWRSASLLPIPSRDSLPPFHRTCIPFRSSTIIPLVCDNSFVLRTRFRALSFCFLE